MTKTRWWACGVALAIVGSMQGGGTAAATFELREKEHICIVGNTLAERLQYDGWLETMLQARFPKHELAVRNLGFSGDEIATRLRSKNFGTPDEWLSGKGGANRRISGKPLRRHQHQSRRDLRLLRLQRVATRGRPASTRSSSSSPTGSRTRWRSDTTARPPRGSCCSRRSRTRISATPISRTAARTTSGSSSTRARWGKSRRRME